MARGKKTRASKRRKRGPGNQQIGSPSLPRNHHGGENVRSIRMTPENLKMIWRTTQGAGMTMKITEGGTNREEQVVRIESEAHLLGWVAEDPHHRGEALQQWIEANKAALVGTADAEVKHHERQAREAVDKSEGISTLILMLEKIAEVPKEEIPEALMAITGFDREQISDLIVEIKKEGLIDADENLTPQAAAMIANKEVLNKAPAAERDKAGHATVINEQLKERIQGTPNMNHLLEVAREMQGRGEEIDPEKLATLTGLDQDEVDHLTVLALANGLLNTGSRMSLHEAVRRTMLDGIVWMPTATLRRFSAIAWAEGLPGAWEESDFEDIEYRGRHLVVRSEPHTTEDGQHYVIAEMALLLNTDSEIRKVTLPMLQYGLFVDGMKGNYAMASDRGEEMPVHAGSRSFEPIWNGLRTLSQTAFALGDVAERKRAKVMGEADVPKLSDPVWKILNAEQLSESGQASEVLSLLRESKVITVGLDVSEGLPNWETPEEAWDYAKEAQLPFDQTFFDFTTPGGYAPTLLLPSPDPDGEDYDIKLRAATVWRDSAGAITISPFAWFAGNDERSYLPAGVVRLEGRGGLEPIQHQPTKGPGNVASLRLSVRNSEIVGMPGWTEIATDLSIDFREGDPYADAYVKAHAQVALISAVRVLSVIYALDSTVNIDLDEAPTSRPERREVQRLERKGKPAEIAQTVAIRATRERQPKEETEGEETPGREYSHAFWRRGHFAHYPIGTKMADAMARNAPSKLVNHPTKGLCRKIYRPPTIVGAQGPEGEEREPTLKSYVWNKPAKGPRPKPSEIAA